MKETYTGDRPQDQAVAICLNYWCDAKKSTFTCEPPKQGEDFDSFMDRCVPSAMAGDPNLTEERAQEQCSIAYEGAQIPGRPGGLHSYSDIKHKTHAEALNGMEFVLSDETPDRMGDVIVAAGWDLTHFKKNPVALWAHRGDLPPIGKWKNLRIENKSLRGHLELAPEGTSPRIDEIRRLVDAGILKAVSVGFRPIASQPRGDGKTYLGETFEKAELVETSLVSVPANPNALAVAKQLAISRETIDMVFAKPGSSTAIQKRELTGKPADTPPTWNKTMSGLLTPRIEESEKRLNGYRDALTEHLKNQNDENVSDAEYQVVHDLNAKIAQEEKTHQALVESQNRLAKTTDAVKEANETDTRSFMEGTTALTVPGSRPFAIPAKKLLPTDYIWRSLRVAVQHHSEQHRRPILEVLKDCYGEDEPTRHVMQFFTRAASAPATIPQAGWAAELVTQVWQDFLSALIPFSVFPGVAAKGSIFTFGRNGVINLPMRNSTPQIAGSFVGEGAPIPVRQGAFATVALTPKKLAVISTFTREISEHSTPAIEGLIREAITQDTGIAVDSILLDSNPATAVRPPGLLNGVTPITATAAGAATVIALNGDLKLLNNALTAATFGNIRNPVWLMNPSDATSASLTMTTTGDTPYRDEIANGTLLSYPIIKSTNVPLHTMILVDAADFAAVTEAAPRFDVSDQAVLHMEDTTPLAIIGGTTGSPAPAVPTRSLWQTDTIGIRMILPMNWVMRRAGMVQYMTGMTWV
jgi:HK97 family phage major capsid protein/HK97 family phage prohead protease